MSEVIKDNIKFSNLPNSSAKGYTGLITSADNIVNKRYEYDPESDPILMALDINWGGAEVDENKIINTTGELLAWIKESLSAAAQSGGSALTEEQIETIETCTHILKFIKQYALSTDYADEHYQAKGNYILASVYNENKAAIDTAIETLQGAVNEFATELNNANETTAEALIQLQEQITNIALTPGPKGDTGPQGPKGDTGATGTFDSSALAGYVTIEQYNNLLARVAAIEAQISSGGGEHGEDNAYITPTRTKPTAASIAEMTFPAQKPTEGLTLETSEITKPTELYLVYPSAWVTANANNDITNPVITDPNGFAQGAWVDSTVTVDGVSYTIIGTELGQDTYTVTFS